MEKTIFNERFGKVYKSLLKRRKVKNKLRLGRILGTYSHIINDLIVGRRQPTIGQLTRLFKRFGINANYIFGKSNIMYIGQLKVFNTPPPEQKP